MADSRPVAAARSITARLMVSWCRRPGPGAKCPAFTAWRCSWPRSVRPSSRSVGPPGSRMPSLSTAALSAGGIGPLSRTLTLLLAPAPPQPLPRRPGGVQLDLWSATSFPTRDNRPYRALNQWLALASAIVLLHPCGRGSAAPQGDIQSRTQFRTLFRLADRPLSCRHGRLSALEAAMPLSPGSGHLLSDSE